MCQPNLYSWKRHAPIALRFVAVVAALAAAGLAVHAQPPDAFAQSPPDPPVCERSPLMQETIVGYVFLSLDVEECEKVTAEHLASITEMQFGPEDVSSLAPSDFNGLTGVQRLESALGEFTTLPPNVFNELTNLEVLRFFEVRLASIPEGIFSGLTNMRVIEISGHRLAGLPDGLLAGLDHLETFSLSGDSELLISVRLVRVPGSDTAAQLSVPVGAPFDMTVGFRSDNAVLSADGEEIHEVTIPTGHTESMTFHIESLSSGGGRPELVLPRLPETDCTPEGWNFLACHDGYRFVDPDAPPLKSVCERTAVIRDAILDAPETQANNCRQVTDEQLAKILQLLVGDPDAMPITLSAGDLGGLRNLQIIYMDDTAIASIEPGFFRHALELNILGINGGSLTTLSTGMFGTLDQLESLSLFNLGLEALPAGLFDSLGNLDVLSLSYNRLESLPQSIFDGLRELGVLQLDDNLLTELPEALFAGLANLREVSLYGNMLTSLPDDTFKGVVALSEFDLRQRNEANPVAGRSLRAPVQFVPTRFATPTGKVMFSIGAPFELQVGISVTGGTAMLADEPIESVTIPAGATESQPFTIELDPSVTSYSIELTPPPVPYTMCGDASLEYLCFQGLVITAEQPAEVVLPETGGIAPSATTALAALLAGLAAVTFALAIKVSQARRSSKTLGNTSRLHTKRAAYS